MTRYQVSDVRNVRTEPAQAVDWTANIEQVFGLKSAQYVESIGWDKRISTVFGGTNLIFTDHSFGGGLASAKAEVISGSHGIQLNSSCLHAKSNERYGVSLCANAKIQAYYVKDEILSMVQD